LSESLQPFASESTACVSNERYFEKQIALIAPRFSWSFFAAATHNVSAVAGRLPGGANA